MKNHYLKAAEKWAALWTTVKKKISNMPLFDAHQQMIRRAEAVLPLTPGENENVKRR
jgi:hypothetical protein